MKRGYYVCGYDEGWGAAVVASSVKEAKKIVFNSDYLEGEEWLEIRARWVRDADVSGLPVGIVEPLGEALTRGFFQYIDGLCEGCGMETTLEIFGDRALCYNCVEKEEVK